MAEINVQFYLILITSKFQSPLSLWPLVTLMNRAALELHKDFGFDLIKERVWGSD